MVNIGAPELVVILLLGLFTLVPLAVGVISLVDIVPRNDGQFSAAGQSLTTWLVVAILSLIVPCVWLGAVYYLVSIRPKLGPRTA